MALPRFYLSPDNLPPHLLSPGTGHALPSGAPPSAARFGLPGTEIGLDEDNSRHIVQVLRMKPGEELQLTDGRGNLLTAVIVEDHKKKCRVRVLSGTSEPSPRKKVTVAISLLKNANRFEWFLEKATEIGVGEIIPLLCDRTEKQHFRQDRMQNILVSAMIQSQQTRLPSSHAPTPFSQLIEQSLYDQRFIAHCLDEVEARIPLAAAMRDRGTAPSDTDDSISGASSSLILIGPEGDFSPAEINLAFRHGFLPVMLGETRLRTETAGVVASALLLNY